MATTSTSHRKLCETSSARAHVKAWLTMLRTLVLALVCFSPALADGFVTLRSINYPDHFIRHRNYLGEITPVASDLDRADASFRMVPGLAGGDSVSFESKNYPGHYLRHQDFRIKLHPADSSSLFRNDASFRVKPGLANASWGSFESVNYPGYHLRHRNYHLYIEQGDGDLYRKDCTFKVLER
jgi:hypothetical protein